MMKPLKAGFARKIISPPKGIYLIGYGDRLWGNKGIHDDLTASALAFDDGENRVVVIACDLLAINELTLQKVRQEVKEKVMLCCSHTHSGPIVYWEKHGSSKNKRYVESLVEQLIGSIREALSDLQPVSVYWGTSRVNLAVNRRERKPDGRIEIGHNPQGHVDRSASIIQVRRENGEPLANLVNFSCHNVVLGPKNLLVSADWAGNMRKRLEEATGSPFLFIQGAAADLNPDHEWSENDFKAVDEIGRSVAADVLSGFADLTLVNSSPVRYQETDIWLLLEVKAAGTYPPKTYRKVLSKIAGVPAFLVDKVLNIRYPWRTIIEPHDGYWAIPLKASALLIGEITWTGLGAEVFNEIGVQLKNLGSSPYNFFSSLTNGCIGYLPTKEEHKLGGYEVDLAPYFYRLPGRLQSVAEEKAIAETQQLIQQLAQG